MGLVATLRLWVLGRIGVRERHEQMAEAARRAAEKAGTIYDAYPGAKKRTPRMRLVILAGSLMETVNLDDYSLDEIDTGAPRWRRELGPRIALARARLKVRLEAEAKLKAEQAYEAAVLREAADKLRAEGSEPR